jgi:flagellar hook-basal body complex protein FliE
MAMPAVNSAAAASAYGNTAKIATVGTPGGDAANATSFTDHMKDASNEPSFIDTAKGVISDAIQSLHEGEKVSAQAITGKANLADVVQATTSAELTLETVVALRDKMMGAYEEIMRMPI